MKKVITMVLAVILTLSLAVPAAAVTSPGGLGLLPTVADNIENETKTKDGAIIRVTLFDPNKGMTEEQSAFWAISQETEAEGKQGMKKVLSDSLASVETIYSDGKTEKVGEGTLSFKLKTPLGPKETIAARLFDGEKWIELPVEYDPATGEWTISGITNADGYGFSRLIIGIKDIE